MHISFQTDSFSSADVPVEWFSMKIYYSANDLNSTMVETIKNSWNHQFIDNIILSGFDTNQVSVNKDAKIEKLFYRVSFNTMHILCI